MLWKKVTMNCPTISASSLQCFRECPLKYHAVYELKIREKDVHPAAIIGSATHKVMEIIAKTKKVPDINQICRDFKVPPADVKVLVKNALRQGYLKNLGIMVDVEYKFKIPFVENSCITGIIDRLDIDETKSSSVIHDLKTGKKAYTREELKDNYQAKLYNIAVRRLYPKIETVDVIFWFVKCRDRKICSFTRDTVEKHEEDIRNDYRSIVGTVDPKPKKNNFCKWCVYFDKCPLYNSEKKPTP